MSYIKLCQISNQSETEIFYLEDCNGKVSVNKPTYPLVLECEVIDWGTQEIYEARGTLVSFASVTVVIAEPTADPIRYNVFTQLRTSYPTLVI